MRILIATRYRGIVGGVETYLRKVLPELDRLGHQVALVYEHSPATGLETIDPPQRPPASWCSAELALPTLIKAVAAWNPDVVYSHGLDSPELQRALLDAYPTVLYAHNYYGTCATGHKSHAFPQFRPCARRFGPMCLLLHYPRRCGGLHPGTMWSMFRQTAQANAQLGDYAAILVASRHMRAEFQRHGIRPDKIHLVPLPVPGDVQGATPLARRTEGRLLFISRLTALKGGAYLIPAIRRAADKLQFPLRLTIAGDGPARNKLELLAHQLDVPVEFTGWVNHSRRLELLRQSDLLAVPSLWPEPFGLVGIEAGSLGVPAVAYAVGGIPDWLETGQSGELAPGDPPTVNGLADAIVRALADPAHYANLRRGALAAAGRFSVAAHITKLEALLQAVRRPEFHRQPEPCDRIQA